MHYLHALRKNLVIRAILYASLMQQHDPNYVFFQAMCSNSSKPKIKIKKTIKTRFPKLLVL